VLVSANLTRAGRGVLWSGLRPKSAHEKDDETDQQNKAKSPAANCGTAKVKAASAEQEEKNKNQ
jgi:hypothetical protein